MIHLNAMEARYILKLIADLEERADINKALAETYRSERDALKAELERRDG